MTRPRSPREYLQTTRPERFSDSDLRAETALDRSVLETHLLTLTARGQESDFETFAKRLCEAEVCPNLVPHTGPDAGGDAKADTQTFPVADVLADTWYVGVGRDGAPSTASHQRWAFAVSTQKTWRPKVRDDVAKIVATDRGYAKVFFVSNQYIPDKDKAAVEDELAQKHGVEVRIFDLSWILDRVFANGREALAVETLGVTGLSRSTPRTGPLDAQRADELAEVEARIHQATQAGGLSRATVDDMVRAAVLARELGHPAAEVEGRFGRARRAAERVGTRHQQVEAAYQLAKTLYYYHEDYPAFSEVYGEVEALALGSHNGRDLDRLATLWSNLYGAVEGGFIDGDLAQIEVRTQTLLADLDRLSEEEDRPSTALWARSLALQARVTRGLFRGEPLDDLLDEVADVVREAEPLPGFPIEPVIETYAVLAPYLDESPAYERLFELLVEVEARREGDVSAAVRLTDRAKHQLTDGRSAAALVSASRALHKLAKEESSQHFGLAFYIGGRALEDLGLLWAARGFYLGAASVAVDEKWKYGKVTAAQATAYRRLKWVEMRLGRVPHLLAWHNADSEARDDLVAQGADRDEMLALHREFDHQAAQLFLRLDADQLDAVRRLPDLLDRLDLQFSLVALLFALGHTELMDELAQAESPDLSADDLAARLALERPHDWPATPHLYMGDEPVTMTSRVLGCQILVTSDPAPHCINVAEALLATIEGFLATTPGRAIAWEPSLTVDVLPDPAPITDGEPPLRIEVEERAGLPHLVVRCRTFDPVDLPLAHQIVLRTATFETAMRACAHVIQFQDLAGDLESLFRDERAFDRAIGFTGVYGAYANVLGPAPQTTLGFWTHPEFEAVERLRDEPWTPPADPSPAPSTESAGGPPHLDTQGHHNTETVSFVHDRLWDRARWRSTLYLLVPGETAPPGIALVFESEDAGREIFQLWRDRLGDADERDQIRLSIVRGVDRDAPHTYRITVGTDVEAIEVAPAGAPRFVNAHVRIRTEEVLSNEVLDRFLEAFEQAGSYFLVPATPDESGSLTIGWDLQLTKRKLIVKPAWEVSLHDLDRLAIRPGDRPVVPDDVDRPPVQDLLDHLGANVPES